MKNEQNRKSARTGIGVLIALAVVMLWVGVAQGASFQPVPNQAFGMHWGTSIEDAKNTRSLKLLDTIDEFTMYLDQSFNMKELPGVTVVGYMFMKSRLGGAFLNLHCGDDMVIFVHIFSTMYGAPTNMDEGSGAIEWGSSGNIIQLFTKSGIMFMGNGKIIEMANDILKKYMDKDPEPKGDGPPVIKPGPKT